MNDAERALFQGERIVGLEHLQAAIWKQANVDIPIVVRLGDVPALPLGRSRQLCFDPADDSVFDLWVDGALESTMDFDGALELGLEFAKIAKMGGPRAN